MTYRRLSVLGALAVAGLYADLAFGQAPAQPAAPPSGGVAQGTAPPAAAPAAPAESAPPGSVPVAPSGPAPGGPAPSAGTTPYYEQAPPPQQKPTIVVEQPPPPPLEPRTRHYHDGFYLRLSLGFGYQGVSSSAPNPVGGDSKVSTSGGGGAIGLLIGGTPVPGLVIGGGILGQSAVSPGQTIEGPPLPGIESYPSGGVGLGVIGPFIDIFPNPSSGFHLGAMPGLAGIGLKGNEDRLSGGLGASVWIGHGWWTAADWSLGGLIRLTAAGTQRKLGTPEIDVSDGAFGFTLEFSAAYH